jgi:hypothetical protein
MSRGVVLRRFEKRGLRSDGCPPIAIGEADVLRKETGMFEGTALEDVRTTRFVV